MNLLYQDGQQQQSCFLWPIDFKLKAIKDFSRGFELLMFACMPGACFVLNAVGTALAEEPLFPDRLLRKLAVKQLGHSLCRTQPLAHLETLRVEEGDPG